MATKKQVEGFFEDILRDMSYIEFHSTDDIFNYIEDTFTPDEVFSKENLEEWALKNGYVKAPKIKKTKDKK